MSPARRQAPLPADQGLAREISDEWDRRRPGDLPALEAALAESLSGTSPAVERLEAAIRRAYEMKHALAVSSGAGAVHVAIASLRCKPGDEIILPPTAPICTVLPLLAQRLVPVFCDVLRDGFGLDPQAVVSAIGSRTRAIIEVPMWGYPTPVEVLRRVAADRHVALVLDLAHAHMAKHLGRHMAHYGDVACYSMHESKFVSTGEGGFVATNDPALDARMRSFSRFGNLDGRTFGLNFKLSGLQAALGAARLEGLEEDFAVRRRNREYLLGRLSNPNVRELPTTDDDTVSGYALLLQVIRGDGRRFVEYLHDRGIPSDIRKYDNRPLYEYPLLAPYRRDCPNAALLLRSITTVPLHPDLTLDDLDYMAGRINDYEA